MRKMSLTEKRWMSTFDAVMKGYVDLIPKISDIDPDRLVQLKLELRRERHARRRDAYSNAFKTDIYPGSKQRLSNEFGYSDEDLSVICGVLGDGRYSSGV